MNSDRNNPIANVLYAGKDIFNKTIIVNERTTCVKISYDTGLFTFLNALKYPQKQDVRAIKGKDKASIINTSLDVELCKKKDTNISLFTIVKIHTQTEIMAHILHAILEEHSIALFFFNSSFSDTILVIASGIPNKETVTKKLNTFIISE